MYKSVLVFVLCISYGVKSQSLFSRPDSLVTKTMSQEWELDKDDKRGTFKLNSYKPFYVHPIHYSSDVNRAPKSESLDNELPENLDLDNVEVKFQISFKTKVVQSFLFGKGDIWVGYTQVAHWQVYNKRLSRPFRELNYEPELIAVYPVDFKFLGFQAKMVSLGFNHQSNGRQDPISRSWNRVMFQMAFERGNFQIYLKPWLRLDGGEEDDNPEITEYIGRAETTVIYKKNGTSISALVTNSLALNDNRGSLQLNYLFPIKNNLRAHLQLFTGYGESLIDYNHYQTTASIGLSFVDW
jgi:phospholipase A1